MLPASKTHRPVQGRTTRPYYEYGGLAQHCLVEHALCPLDVNQAFAPSAIHEYSYFFLDKNRNTKTASVRVACPFGLSPNDEFYLWGLLHLTFSQQDPAPEFVATPHYCLRQLGIVHKGADQQKRYDTFRQAIQRLSGVVYQNGCFYDPIRGEHRDISFGLLKYNLPLDPQSSRAWRFVWDQQFFTFSNAMRGSFQFDLDLYRELDYATRRMFLFLKKLFWRRETITLDVAHLAVNVAGFSPSIPVADLKIKLCRCVDKLLARQVIRLPDARATPKDLFSKRAKGKYHMRLSRGPYFDQPARFGQRAAANDSPCCDPLKAIGFSDSDIGRILEMHDHRMVQEWADITLAAIERKMITKDPKAFFRYYIRKAANREATPPDWWRELRKREERRRREEERAICPTIADAVLGTTSFTEAFDKYLQEEAKGAFEKVASDLFNQFRIAGHTERDARHSADQFARQHMRSRFLSEHPELRDAA